MAAKFQLVSEYAPAGDQPKAIEQILGGFAGASRCACSWRVLQPGSV
ncbi:MAG TPA: hypothetical protein VMZ71_10790 [Gemmataceae bacterium]|nr:hypothetical protein [Gemmataceae bacterium]